MFYGSDAAVMIRESKAWMFKEVDSPLLGWEVYASKRPFYKETGIVLGPTPANPLNRTSNRRQSNRLTNTPIFYALQKFACATPVISSATAEDFLTSYRPTTRTGLWSVLAKVPRRPAAGYLEGFQATVTAVKANEAILGTANESRLKPRAL